MRNATLALFLVACSASPAPGSGTVSGPPVVATTTAPTVQSAPPATTATAASRPPSSAPVPAAPRPAACRAPSLALDGPADSHTEAQLADCRFAPTGLDDLGDACGTPAFDRPVALDRLDEAAPPLDPGTVERVRTIAEMGRGKGRRRGVFLLVGDSITASPKFMTPLSADPATAITSDILARLSVDGMSIVERYRATPARAGLDSFVAPKAAKIGAQSRWALAGTPSPLDEGIAATSPAVAVVLFGSNDAAVRAWPLDEIASRYRARMTAILDRLESEGIVPILSTVPRHTHDPKRAPCDRSPHDVSNWRMAVQTTVVSRVAAALACERSLPLIDLRWALDALPNHGIGPDGVHPNAFRRGAGVLDPQGLQCGFNVRNYVTLRMLARVWPFLAER